MPAAGASVLQSGQQWPVGLSGMELDGGACFAHGAALAAGSVVNARGAEPGCRPELVTAAGPGRAARRSEDLPGRDNQSISAWPLMPLLGQSGPRLDAHIASLSASIALVHFPLLALLDFRFICSGY